MKIMIVDDNPVNVDVLRRTLEGVGYEILMAPTGEVALKLAPLNLPDLILLDVMMPGIDGFETCAQLKKIPELEPVPVIFVTGKTGGEDIVRGFQVGGADYISKPFRQEEVLARAKTHLELYKANQQNRKMVEELKAALLKMEDAQQESLAKDKFLSRMSHELRTPMNAILGFAQLLQRNPRKHLDDKDLELVDEILTGGRHLMDLITRVLDFSNMEEERLHIQTQPVKLSEIVRESLAGQLESVGREIAVENLLDENMGPCVQADPDLVREIVDILLDNAIKYNSDNGGMVIESHVTPSGRVQLCVEDEGPGVPEAEREKIFQPLYRMQKHVDAVNGIGMGLACARKYAHLMNATLNWVAGSGGGSRFILEMDAAGNVLESKAGCD